MVGEDTQAKTAPVVSGRGLQHSYVFSQRRVPSLRGVDIRIEPGEFVAIVGRNGCGKSTLAKHFNMLVELQKGELAVAGLDCSKPELAWEVRRHCGMVFQNPDNQFVSTIVREDIEFGLENFDIDEEIWGERTDRALGLVHMDGFAGANPHRLSGGQKQRVALAGILAIEPDIVILDEATTMLPPEGRLEVLDVLEDLHCRKQTTIIMITHYIEEAARVDRVVGMSEGRIVGDGPSGDVLDQSTILRGAGLELPLLVRLRDDLAAGGIELPKHLTSPDEFADAFAEVVSSRQPLENAMARPQLSGNDKPVRDLGAETTVEIANLSFSYAADAPLALKDVNLSFGAGTFTGIVGATGSGKSTLIQLMAGLYSPTAGAVFVDGEDINAPEYDRRRLRRKLGIVFQYPETQLFERTVFKDVRFGLKRGDFSEAEQESRARWALSAVGFDPDAIGDKSPLGLSGGEKRRVALAGVLAVRPKILILDEPVAGLDPSGRASLMALLDNLKEEGTTIIMVSHNADCLSEHADRIIALSQGAVEIDAPPREAYADCARLTALGVGCGNVRQISSALEERKAIGTKGIIAYDDLVKCLIEGFGERCV